MKNIKNIKLNQASTKQAVALAIIGVLAIFAVIVLATIAVKIGLAILSLIFSPIGLSAIGGALAMFAVIYYIAMKR